MHCTGRCLFLYCSVRMGGGGECGRFVMNSQGISGGEKQGGRDVL
jgi:hypothetical protein